MEEKKQGGFLQVIIFLQFISIVSCFGAIFQRIDENEDSSATVGFTKIFHQCSIDPNCNFAVKRNKNSDMEKRQNIDDNAKLFNVWR